MLPTGSLHGARSTCLQLEICLHGTSFGPNVSRHISVMNKWSHLMWLPVCYLCSLHSALQRDYSCSSGWYFASGCYTIVHKWIGCHSNTEQIPLICIGTWLEPPRPSATLICGLPINQYCHFLFKDVVAIILTQNRHSWYALIPSWSLCNPLPTSLQPHQLIGDLALWHFFFCQIILDIL